MENIIGLKEFRAQAGKIIDKVAQGQSFVVIKRSKPVFRVSPVDEEENWENLIDFTKIKKGGIPIDKVLTGLRARNKKYGQTAKSAR